MSENRFEHETPVVATQQEMLQLLAEVEKITVFGENMEEWGNSWSTAELVDDLDNGHIGSATHKNNPDIPPVSCKFNKNALHKADKRSIAQLAIGGHTYDFFIRSNYDANYEAGTSVSSALEDMWVCDELYSTTYDETGATIPKDPSKPIYMPASNYNLSNIELLEVYVDLPPDRRKFTRSLGLAVQKFAELLPEEADADDIRLNSMEAIESADHDHETREFEMNLGATQIDSTTARQLAKSLAEDYQINVRW